MEEFIDFVMYEYPGFPGYRGYAPKTEEQYLALFGAENPWPNKPTWAELVVKLDEYIVNKHLKEVNNNRQKAYVAESDPLFFKAQRGEATTEEWLAKVQEIKNRYPKP